ncbi:MAG: hypothetical protein V4496_00435 [Pseudomonadota bacterium]
MLSPDEPKFNKFSSIHHYFLTKYQAQPSDTNMQTYAQYFWDFLNHCLIENKFKHNQKTIETEFGEILVELIKNNITLVEINHYCAQLIFESAKASSPEEIGFYRWFLVQIALPFFINNFKLSDREFRRFSYKLPKFLVEGQRNMPETLLFFLSKKNFLGSINRLIKFVKDLNLSDDSGVYYQISCILNSLLHSEVNQQTVQLEALILQRLLFSQFSFARDLSEQTILAKHDNFALMSHLFCSNFLLKLLLCAHVRPPYIHVDYNLVFNLLTKAMKKNPTLCCQFNAMLRKNINFLYKPDKPELVGIDFLSLSHDAFVQYFAILDHSSLRLLCEYEGFGIALEKIDTCKKPQNFIRQSYLSVFVIDFTNCVEQEDNNEKKKFFDRCCESINAIRQIQDKTIARTLLMYLQFKKEFYAEDEVLLNFANIFESRLISLVNEPEITDFYTKKSHVFSFSNAIPNRRTCQSDSALKLK